MTTATVRMMTTTSKTSMQNKANNTSNKNNNQYQKCAEWLFHVWFDLGSLQLSLELKQILFIFLN